jgi:hypothetical protein
MAITRATKSMKEYNKTLQEANDLEQTNNVIMGMLTDNFNNGTASIFDTANAMQHFGIQSNSAVGVAADVASSIQQGFANMAGSIGDTFFDVFSGVTSAFDGLKSIAAAVFQMIAKVVIQSMIVKPLMAAMGIPGYAQGGLATGGKPAIVGENGPELIVPSSNTRVFSSSQTSGMLGGASQEEPLTVNFNLNAVSTRDGVEFLIENKNTITSVIQEAYQTRGRNGPLG